MTLDVRGGGDDSIFMSRLQGIAFLYRRPTLMKLIGAKWFATSLIATK
jgi:hypothetical protein